MEIDENELVFVVDVSRFTQRGFAADTSFNGEQVQLEFDEDGDGIHLSTEMARKIGAMKGATLSLIVEDGTTVVSEAKLSSVGAIARISDSKVYYAIGREGGAVIKIRKA